VLFAGLALELAALSRSLGERRGLLAAGAGSLAGRSLAARCRQQPKGSRQQQES
jgi:hypothetical protein